MAELPQMPLFVDDFEAATAHLDLEEDGAYNRLLRLCWRQSSCSVPDDDEWIRRRMRVDSEKYERVIRPIIDEFFTRSGGRVFQKRQRQVREFARKKKTVRQDAGRKGGLAKAMKNKETSSSNAKDLPEQNSGNALASKPYQTSKGLGLERRSLRPGGQDPPPTKPDPEKFVMTAEWVMPTDLHDELTAEYVPKLGFDPFWRQIERFIAEHDRRGTVDTADGFAELLRGWLERADANRQKLPLASTGADPPKPASKDIVPSMCTDDFRDRVAKLYDDALAASGKKRMELVECARIKTKAGHMKIGKTPTLGLARGPTWTVAEVLRALGLTKSEAA